MLVLPFRPVDSWNKDCISQPPLQLWVVMWLNSAPQVLSRYSMQIFEMWPQGKGTGTPVLPAPHGCKTDLRLDLTPWGGGSPILRKVAKEQKNPRVLFPATPTPTESRNTNAYMRGKQNTASIRGSHYCGDFWPLQLNFILTPNTSRKSHQEPLPRLCKSKRQAFPYCLSWFGLCFIDYISFLRLP